MLAATILLVGASASAESNHGERPLVLTEFDEKNLSAAWKTVNDNVMGGRSKGGPKFGQGKLAFTGATNTNGGGFSSIRTKPGKYDLSGKAGLLIRAKGDGRTYKAELRTDVTRGRWSIPFRADFKTFKGEWREVFIPFESFTPSFHGRRLSNPPALDVAKVSSFGFMIYDKKDGAFNLEVDWVKAVSGKSVSKNKGESGSIVDQVLKDGRFNTLATALTKAELVKVLQGKGPFTVFAPTDKAFTKLPKGTVAELLKPENRKKLQAVLRYHVSVGKTGLAAALGAGKAKTVQGQSLTVVFSKGRVRVNDASILDADIQCSNGVVHVIDTVLLPPKPKNDILSVAKRAGSFTTLLAAVKAAGLEEGLSGQGPYTIFAPTDEAFKALPKGTVEELLKPKNRTRLKTILAYHAIAGQVSAGDALNAKKAETLSGMSVKFGIANGVLQVNGATIRKTDIKCDNGVIHVIDAVLLPPARKKPGRAVTATAHASPTELIETAIKRGVPIFNAGNSEKCAAIYKDCLVALLKSESLDAKMRMMLKKLLDRAEQTHSSYLRAWQYRSGLDYVYAALSRS